MDKYKIKYVLIPQEQGIGFREFVPRAPDINIKNPAYNDTLIDPPHFSWDLPCTCSYAISLCREDAIVFNTYRDLKINLLDQWVMPSDIWSSIPNKQKIYWYVYGLDKNVTSRLMVFYKQ
jgi:hypothetical protein